jgi:2',3'-cyclic-nucleotide 2'-phosphodiesterase (5'-nucleotidase family)
MAINSRIPSKMHVYFVALVLAFVSCQKHVFLADASASFHRIEHGTMRVDTSVANVIFPYKAKVDAAMGEVIGHCDMELLKAKPTSLLTNWMADAVLEESRAETTGTVDIAILNYGGVRVTSMPAGKWTVGSVYELMPFDNVVFITHITGRQVKQLCDHIAAAGGWPVSHTLRFSLFYGKAADITVHGLALDTTAMYSVAVPDYIFQGGDNVTFLKESTHDNTGLLIRDLLIRHVRNKTKSGQTIHVLPDPRIK